MPKTDFTAYGTKKVTLKPPILMSPSRIMLQMIGLRRAETAPACVIEVPVRRSHVRSGNARRLRALAMVEQAEDDRAEERDCRVPLNAASPPKQRCDTGPERGSDDRCEGRHGAENAHGPASILVWCHDRHRGKHADERSAVADQPKSAKCECDVVASGLRESGESGGRDSQSDQQRAFLTDAGCEHARGQADQQRDDAVHSRKETDLRIGRPKILLNLRQKRRETQARHLDRHHCHDDGADGDYPVSIHSG